MSAAAVPSGPIPTLWSGDGPQAAYDGADELLAECRPPWIQVHTWEPGATVAAARRLLPGVGVIVGVGVDGVAREVAAGRRSVEWGRRTLVNLARRAAECGAFAIVWNAEGGWKTPPNTEQRRRLSELVRTTLAEVARDYPQLAQWHTSYDHPHYHSTYNWLDWLGASSPITVTLPQVYAAPAGGLMAHRGALPAREARSLASYARFIRQGLIKPDAPDGAPEDLTDLDWLPYYQAHRVLSRDTIASALTHRFACLWALPSRIDREGRNAFRLLCELHHRGLWTPDGVARLQADVGATVDNVCGPQTAARARISWEPPAVAA